MAVNTERNSLGTEHTNDTMLNHFTEGERIIEFPTESRSNVALVLGNTGVGKSTFVHYVFGDDSNLISTEAINPDTNDPTGEYTIKDTSHRIGQATLVSHTQVPEVIFDQKTNTSIYDCPGFADNRNAIYDIAGTYFTKKIIERSKNLKFVFVVNYASVTSGADKTDFISLAKQLTNMIKNIDKFKDGFSLIATKVKDFDKSDTLVRNTIATYLTSAMQELKRKVKKAQNEDKNMLSNLAQDNQIIKLIETLLTKDGKNYTKIGFLRQPREPGPLSKIEAMQTHKLTLLKLFHENTKFIKYDDPADFSYTISADSLNYVDKLMHEIHEQISHKIETIVGAIQQHYNHLVQGMENKINSLVNGAHNYNINALEGQALIDKLGEERKITENLINEMANITISDLPTKLNNTITTININSKDALDNVSTISNLASFLKFLQSFHNLALPTHQWSLTFSEIPKFLSTSCDHLQATASNAIHGIHEQISRNINAIVGMIQQYYDDLVQGMEQKINSFVTSTAVIEANPSEVQIFLHKLDKGKTAIENLTHEINNITIADLSTKLQNTVDNLDARNDDISTNISTISNFGNYLKFLQPFQTLALPTDRWTISFNNIPIFMSTSADRVRTTASKVTHEIYEKISHKIDEIVDAIKQYYGGLLQQMENTLNSFITSTVIINVNASDSQIFMEKFNDGKTMTEKFVNEVKNITTTELSIKLNNTIGNLNINNSEMVDNISSISKLENFLLFLQSFNNLTLPTHQWSATFNDAATFFFTSSNHLHENVTSVRNQIERNIRKNMLKSENAIKTYFSTKEEATTDIKKLLSEVTDQHDNVRKIQELIRKVREPKECIKQIIKNLITIGMDTAKSVFSSSTQYENYLEYLKNLQSIGERSTNSLKCSEGLNDVIKYLIDSKKWYSFVLALYNRLSEYEIQRNTLTYKVIGDRLIAENENKPVRDTGLKLFLEACCQNLYQQVFDRIEYIILDKPKLDALKKVIHITLKDNIEILSSQPCESKLVIRGRFVKLSDITRIHCSAPIKSIEIFALDKVFIDTSIDKTGEKTQLSIFAPTWDVRGTQKIILDGKPGESHKITKAKNGEFSGATGEDGEPGLPGEPAGNFLGHGKTVINFENLIISAVGGKGGPGQEGGNGKKGVDAEDPTITPVFSWAFLHGTYEDYLPNPFPGFAEKMFEIRRTYYEHIYGIFGIFLYTDSEFEVYKDGGNGGNGGNGGHGGIGGNQGQIVLSIINTNSDGGNSTQISGTFIDTANSKIISRSGDQGTDGFKGLGGMPGRQSNLLKVLSKYNDALDVDNLKTDWGFKFDRIEGYQSCKYKTKATFCHYLTQNYYSTANWGSDGASGANIRGIVGPEAAVPFDSSRTTNEYKNYLRENLNGNPHELDLKNFLDQLDHNTSTYDTLGFIYEFHSLEEQFQKLHEKISFLPYYKSLLARITEYAQRSKPNETSPEYKKVLGYLYTATNSRIYALNRMNDDFIINIKQYFDSMINDIGELKDFNLAVEKNHLKRIYDTKVNAKIDEAKKFIDHDIAQEIDKIIRQTDNQIRLLIDEIIVKKNDAKLEKVKLEKQKRKLQDQLTMRRILGVLQVVSNFFAFSGHIGKLAGIGIEAASMVTEKLAFANIGNQAVNEILKLPAAINNFATNLTLQHDTKQHNAKVLLNDESANSEKQATIKKIAKIMNEIGIHFMDKIQENEAKIVEINEVMTAVDNNISKLGQHEMIIYKEMIPACKRVQDAVIGLDSILQGQSLAALDIGKWKMQDTIRELQFQVQKMTKGFNVEEDIRHCIEKLEYGMTMTIQMYDRIQQYHEDKGFADYLSSITSTQAKDVDVKDVQLRNTIDELNLIIQSNLVLREYERAVNAFLQYKFPFAHLLLEQFELPSYLQLMNTTTNMADQAVSKIRNIKTALEKNNASIDRLQDSYKISEAKFDGQDGKQPPFYVWNYEDNKGAISKLLQGQEITIEADITKAPIADNAIKFNEIGIRLKLSNSTKQAELDEHLKGLSVEMIHLGNSYYRCDKKIYAVTHESQLIVHSMNRNAEGQYELKNEVYKKIKDNEPVLGPYTLWKIKLSQELKKRPYNFTVLEKYMDQSIHLQLEGRAQYLKSNSSSSICDDKLEKYYTLHKIIPDDDVNLHHQEDHSRKRRAIPQDNLENTETPQHLHKLFETSSSARITSPINRAFNWLTSSLEQLKFWNPASIITGSTFFNHDTSSSSISSENPMNDNIKDTLSSTYDKFNLNETLVLADLLLKYFTKVKPYNANNRSIDPVELKALTLDVVEKFETLLSDMCAQIGMPEANLELDPITLMAKLEKKIVNSDLAGIGHVLYESIDINDNRDFDKDLFKGQIQDMIEKMLKQQNDSSHNQRSIVDYSSDGVFSANMMRNEMTTKYDNSISISSNIDLIA